MPIRYITEQGYSLGFGSLLIDSVRVR